MYLLEVIMIIRIVQDEKIEPACSANWRIGQRQAQILMIRQPADII
jgi:hypothetical protein